MDFYRVQFAILNRLFRLPFIRKAHRLLFAPPAPDTTLRPVFIVGCGHSGTSVLTAILDAHPNLVALAGESYAFRPWFTPAQVRRYYQGRLDALAWHGKRPLEKTPRHVHEIERILTHYPNAQVLYITRDGRDVVASILKRTGKLEAAMDRFVYDNTVGLAACGHDHIWQLSYEALVKDPAATLRGVLEFLGEPYHDLHLHYATQSRDWYAPKSGGSEHSQRRRKQINQPLFDGSGKWRQSLSAEELKRFYETCGATQKALGYE